MRYRLPPAGSGISPASLTSMIDIIFLLIIFFVVTANFDQAQVDSEVALPEVDSAAIKSLPQERLMINVLADGSVRTGFHHLAQAEIQEKLGTVMKSLKTDKESTVLIINGDRETPYKHISTVMNIAALAGYSQVRINAEVKEPGQ